MVELLQNPASEELDALTSLWEASVRATHNFLAPEDIAYFRQIVRREALLAVDLYVIRSSSGNVAAFAGISHGMLEMLFVAP